MNRPHYLAFLEKSNDGVFNVVKIVSYNLVNDYGTPSRDGALEMLQNAN